MIKEQMHIRVWTDDGRVDLQPAGKNRDRFGPSYAELTQRVIAFNSQYPIARLAATLPEIAAKLGVRVEVLRRVHEHRLSESAID